jgi:hypothetical protein
MDHPNRALGTEKQVMKLLAAKFSSSSSHFTLLRSKYSPQLAVPKPSHSGLSSYCKRPSFTPLHNINAREGFENDWGKALLIRMLLKNKKNNLT